MSPPLSSVVRDRRVVLTPTHQSRSVDSRDPKKQKQRKRRSVRDSTSNLTSHVDPPSVSFEVVPHPSTPTSPPSVVSHLMTWSRVVSSDLEFEWPF